MIGDNIKKLRTDVGMTQKDLADKMFVTAQAVSKWENGESEPSISTIAEMAKLFNVTADVILGVNTVPSEPPEPQILKEVVYKETKPVLGVCETCNNPIYSADEIVRKSQSVFCKSCDDKAEEQKKQRRISLSKSKRVKSFWLGGLISAVILAVSIVSFNGDVWQLVGGVVLAIAAFTLISCCLFRNNAVGEIFVSIASFGFVKMPGVIFTLDLDGIIWLITVKLFLWIVSLLLALAAIAVAGLVCGFVSVFVYPFALHKNICHPELFDDSGMLTKNT